VVFAAGEYQPESWIARPKTRAINCLLFFNSLLKRFIARNRFPLDEYPAWCVVTSQISDPLMMRPGSLNSVAPLGPKAGIWNPLAKAPTLFFGTELDSVTAKVGYSFSARMMHEHGCIIRPAGFDYGLLSGFRSGLALSKAPCAASKLRLGSG